MSRATVLPRVARRMLTPTGGYLAGFTHSLQPYAGCEFACVYCYVREMAVQRTNPARLPWSRWISPKTNAVEQLRAEARRGTLSGARVFCSSATDPYTPQERRLRLTRGCLEVLAEHPARAFVLQTRSPLVVRDRDVLAQLPRTVVSVTVTTDDERVRRLLEPNAPSIALRIDALRALRAAGLRTQATLSPLLPCDPERLAALLDAVVDRVVVDDFFAGDGAGGRRSRAALALLRANGHAAWSEPGYAADAVATLRRALGAERVAWSQVGFADLAWLEAGLEAVTT